MDWTFFRDGPIVLFHDQEILNKDIHWLKEHHYLTKSFDCSAWETMNDFHKDVYQQLNFPEYYGKGMDAFNDCMWDVPVPDIGGMTILLNHFDQFQNESRINLEILAIHIFHNITYGKRLLVLIQIEDHIFNFFPCFQ
ncbi:MAG: barstar family protein [Anaerolineaceae bacterium]|nr:barstar family protein [Anaerolineaceae bacterium]